MGGLAAHALEEVTANICLYMFKSRLRVPFC